MWTIEPALIGGQAVMVPEGSKRTKLLNLLGNVAQAPFQVLQKRLRDVQIKPARLFMLLKIQWNSFFRNKPDGSEHLAR